MKERISAEGGALPYLRQQGRGIELTEQVAQLRQHGIALTAQVVTRPHVNPFKSDYVMAKEARAARS